MKRSGGRVFHLLTVVLDVRFSTDLHRPYLVGRKGAHTRPLRPRDAAREDTQMGIVRPHEEASAEVDVLRVSGRHGGAGSDYKQPRGVDHEDGGRECKTIVKGHGRYKGTKHRRDNLA